MEFRPASEADLAAEYAVFVGAQEDLHGRSAAGWASRPFDPDGMWAQVQRHLLAHDAARCFVAEEDGRLVGFAAALVRDGLWHFAALFVDPAAQGRGVGSHLLDLAWDGTHQFRATITEAIQPISTGLYARRGLLPVTPMLGFAGRPGQVRGDADELQRVATVPGALRDIDLAAYGFDRAPDHELWARTSARSTLWLRAGEPCAYSYRGGFPGQIGPVAGLDPGSAASALRAELADTPAGEEIAIDIPGTATNLVEVALEAGLRLTEPGLLLLSASHRPPSSLAIHSYWLL